jgi:hypothetical protein
LLVVTTLDTAGGVWDPADRHDDPRAAEDESEHGHDDVATEAQANALSDQTPTPSASATESFTRVTVPSTRERGAP